MHYRLLFRCTCGLWASVGFCHHVHAVMSKHRRVEGVKDDLVVKFLRPMQNPVAQRQFAGEERHGRLRNAVPGALVRQPDSPSFVSAAQLRATAASMGVAHGIRRGGKERTRLMQAIASEAVRQHSPRPGAGSSSTSGDAAGGAHGDAGGGHCDGGSSSAAAGSAGASSAGAGSAGAAHPMLVRAEAEAGSGGSGSRQGGGGTRTRTRRQEAQAQPSAAAGSPPVSGAVAQPAVHRMQCGVSERRGPSRAFGGNGAVPQRHGENQLHVLMGGDDHGGHAFEG